jgi:hypothetical protein
LSPSAELYPWITLAAIAWGLIDVFFGYRLFKITLAVIGGVIGCVLGHTLADTMGFATGGTMISFVMGGLIGAGVAWLLYLAGVFIAGFGFGASLAILLLSHFNYMVAMLSGCVLGIVGGFLAIKMQQMLLVLSTSLLGAFRVAVATAYFTNHIDWYWYVENPQHLPALIDNHPWMLPAIVILATIGIFAQFGYVGSNKKKGKDRDD